MIRNIFIYLLTGILVLSCSSAPEVSLQVTNPMNHKRSDAIILLSRGEISRWLDIPGDMLPVLRDQQGDNIPCQTDDLDGDGQWDELFALHTMEPKASETIVIQFVLPEEYPLFPDRTNLHLGDAENNYQKLSSAQRLEDVSYHNYAGITEATFQMEGAAWENDKVGFRNYMDQRNGMDIFGKTTTAMVMDGVGKKGEPSYHEPGEWGMDVLKVGTSLGAGAIAYMYKDSLYRVGDNGSGSYDVVFSGPLRSRFNLNFSNWTMEDQTLNVVHQIDIIAGRRCYQSNVIYEGMDASMALAPGIVNMKSTEMHLRKLNDQYSALITHDHQSEDSTLLAMALLVPNTYLKAQGETRNEGEGIIQTYYALLDATPGESVPYRFYALWEHEDPRWSSMEAITDYLKMEAERWTQSVVYANQQ